MELVENGTRDEDRDVVGIAMEVSTKDTLEEEEVEDTCKWLWTGIKDILDEDVETADKLFVDNGISVDSVNGKELCSKCVPSRADRVIVCRFWAELWWSSTSIESLVVAWTEWILE